MSNIHIRNKENVRRKINSIKSSGPASFHVIADFDKTLTRARVDGKKVISSYALLRNGDYLDQSYVDKSHAMFAEYHPYEIDPKFPMDVKMKKMEEWWKKHYELMVECGMQKHIIEEIIARGEMKTREGFDTFMKMLEDHNTPLLIFSAGQGDMIKEFLKQNKKITPNVHLISNFYKFNDEGRVVGYHTPFIHTFNKNEVAIKGTPYYQEIKEHKHVVLLGDQIADLEMSQGIEHDVIITIGFLNVENQDLHDEFSEKYDVVILNDGTLEYANDLITYLLS